MPDRVLVAHDGSDLAREAFACALAIASAAGIPILALHVIEATFPAPVLGDPLLAFDPAPLVGESPEERAARLKDRRAWAERTFALLRAECDKASVPFESRIEEGELVRTLQSVAAPGDILAIGKRGRFATAGLGSATRSLVRHASCPVLVVGAPVRALTRVLAVFDGAQASRKALEVARSVARQTGWPLTVLACAAHGLTLDAAVDEARRLAPEGSTIPFARERDDETALLEQAAANAGLALLVMGAYPDSWLHELLFGSTAPKVLKSIGAPILLAH